MRYFIFILCLLLFGWLIGLWWFLLQIGADDYVDPLSHVDAVVVLTGGQDRIPAALKFFDNKKADYLFISGVNDSVRLAEIWEHFGTISYDESIKDIVILDKEAHDTHSNAVEVAKWVNEKEIGKFILVTSNYHMPRSLLEFEKYIATEKIIPYRVHPSHIKLDHWWEFKGTRHLLLAEYHKYLAVLLGVDDYARLLMQYLRTHWLPEEEEQPYSP